MVQYQSINGNPKIRLLVNMRYKVRFDSPFHKRMAHLTSLIPHELWEPGAAVMRAHIQRMAEMDIGIRIQVKDLERRLPSFWITRARGGSGFIMATLLREYFIEYFSRWMEHGPLSLPSSFNVMESFLIFNKNYLAFDLRSEREHLLALYHYFDWYTSNGLPNDPAILLDVMQDGLIYSYNMTNDIESFYLSTSDSKLAISGVSLVRHGNELSCVVLAGENPPYPPDEDIRRKRSIASKPTKGHEAIAPALDWNISDRYLPGFAKFSRVIFLSRFDLTRMSYDVRYVLCDDGPGFMIFSDDEMMFTRADLGEGKDAAFKVSREGLDRYQELFSAAAALIYLPLVFVDNAASIDEARFITELKTMEHDESVKKAINELGRKEVIFNRSVHCLGTDKNPKREDYGRIDPPEMEFSSDGYWRHLVPGQIGEDRNGDHVVGKTWVKRLESWSARNPESFLLQKSKPLAMGPDPGIIYIVRSPGHNIDVYKIGLTRRTVDERIRELGCATGVPLPFAVLAKWEVENCAEIEKEVHRALEARRVNSRREFFFAPLPEILAVIQRIIAETKLSGVNS
jgi:hypothetical protein